MCAHLQSDADSATSWQRGPNVPQCVDSEAVLAGDVEHVHDRGEHQHVSWAYCVFCVCVRVRVHKCNEQLLQRMLSMFMIVASTRTSPTVSVHVLMCLCVCVCVWERERERVYVAVTSSFWGEYWTRYIGTSKSPSLYAWHVIRVCMTRCIYSYA